MHNLREHPQRDPLQHLPVRLSEVSGSLTLFTAIVNKAFLAGQEMGESSLYMNIQAFVSAEGAHSQQRELNFCSQQPFSLAQL